MRLIIMGTGPFAVPMFHALAASEHDVVTLYTRPLPKVRSRGKAPVNPMRSAAEEMGIDVLSPEDINEESVRTQLASLRPDLFVVCDYGQILSADTLKVAPLGGINLHGSLLPKYRGAAPVQWAILCGEEKTGVTVIHMTPRLDAGPAIVQTATPIGPQETAEELEPRLAQLGVSGVLEAIDLLIRWDGESELGVAQDPAMVTKAPRLRKKDGAVNWARSATEIFNQVRGLKPWPGTYTSLPKERGGDLRLILTEVEALHTEFPGKGIPDGKVPGQILVADSEGLQVATGEGALAIYRLQPAGKRVMTAAEFLRGHRCDETTRFVSSVSAES